MARIPRIGTAAPPIAIPAIAPGLRDDLDDGEELEGVALADDDEEEEDDGVGAMVVGVKAVGVAVDAALCPPEEDAADPAMPSAVKFT